jgi:hypothetical protein
MNRGMASQTPPLRKPRQRPRNKVFGALLALFALCLRLAWPGPATPLPSPNLDLAAAFGEHALCLAAADAEGKVPLPPNGGSLPQSGDHADHDGLGCCLWHAAASATLPRAADGSPVLFVFASDILPAAEAPSRFSRPIGPLQARAPPAAT